MEVELLDFLIILIGVYLVTQILVPMWFPRTFEINWLFKKQKPPTQTPDENTDKDDLTTKIKHLDQEKKSLKQKTKEVKNRTSALLKEAKGIDSAAEKLNK